MTSVIAINSNKRLFKEVNVQLLKTEKLILAAGPNHGLSDEKSIIIEDLEGETLLLPKTD